MLLGEMTAIALFAYEFDSFFQYAAADRLIRGETMYRDFAYQQWPLLPFIYAAVFSVTGVSLISGRVIGLLFGIATIALSARFLALVTRKFGGASADATAAVRALLWLHVVFFLPACYLVLYDTKTYLVSLLMIGLAYLFAIDHKVSRSGMAGAVAAVLGLIKMTYAPIGMIYLATKILWRRYDWRQALIFSAAYLLPIAVVVGYFLLVAPAHFRYQTYEALISSKQAGFDTSGWLFGYLHIRSFVQGTVAIVGGYLALPLVAAVFGLRKPATADSREWTPLMVFSLVGVGLWMFFVSTILPGRGNGPHYFAPFVPVVLMFTALGLQQSGFMARFQALPVYGQAFIAAVVLALNLNLIHSLGTYAPRPIHLKRMIAQYTAAHMIEQHTAPGALGLGYGRYPHSLLLAGRNFVTGNETTVHWIDAPVPDSDARRYHILTKARWRELITARTADFLLVDDDDVTAMLIALDLTDLDFSALGYRRVYRDSFAGLYVRDSVARGLADR